GTETGTRRTAAGTPRRGFACCRRLGGPAGRGNEIGTAGRRKRIVDEPDRPLVAGIVRQCLARRAGKELGLVVALRRPVSRYGVLGVGADRRQPGTDLEQRIM